MSSFARLWLGDILRLAMVLAAVVPMNACQDHDPLAPTSPQRGIPKPNKTLSDGGLGVTYPVGMNAAGEVIGSLYYGGNIYHSGISLHGVAYDIGTVNDAETTSSSPAAINNRGQVVGSEYVEGVLSLSYLWTPSQDNGITGTIVSVPETPQGAATATGINDAGEIVGYTPSAIVLWIGADVVELPAPVTGTISFASINRFGQVAGTASDANGIAHAFLWTPNAERGTTGRYVLLDAAEFGNWSTGLNDFGQVVVNGGDGAMRVWTPASPNGTTGSFIALDGPYGALYNGDINNRGDVIASGSGPEDSNCGPTKGIYLWRPSAPNGPMGVLINVTPDLGAVAFAQDFWSTIYFCSADALFVSEEESGSLQVFGATDGYGYKTWTFTHLDLPPLWGVVTTIDPPYEDENVFFDGSGNNPYVSLLTYQWDFGDGASGTGPFPSHRYADSGPYLVRLTVSDSTGQTSTASATINVANKAPGGVFAVSPTALNEGASYAMTISRVWDAPGDLATLQLSLDCGDGRGYQSGGVGATITCSAPNDAVRTARARLADKDGGVTEYTQQVTIHNLAPAVTILSAPTTASTKAAFTVSFKFVDDGVQDRWNYTIDWGDGAATAPISIATQGGTISASHLYQVIKKGGNPSVTYTVTVRVTDDGGGVGSASRSVVVSPGGGGR